MVLALTHRSFAYENGGLPTNERLEFLGDSVLGVIITDVLYRTHPDLPEGRLAKLRASVVNMHALAGVGRRIGLGQQLRLGRGEEMTGGRDKSSIVADAVEAIIGAVYLQYGLETTRQVIHRLFADLLTAAPQLGAGLDWKTSLQELSAARGLGVPEYRVSEEGPDHAKLFAAQVLLGGLAARRGLRPHQEGSRAECRVGRLHQPAQCVDRRNGSHASAPRLRPTATVGRCRGRRHAGAPTPTGSMAERRGRARRGGTGAADRGESRAVTVGRHHGRPTTRIPPGPVPELPEVEVVRRGLTTHLVGRRIAEVEVYNDRAVRRHPGGAADFRAVLPGTGSPPCAAAASTCGGRWTTATRSSRTWG